MSAKTSPQRRAAFFRALRETGNQTLACERAKVSRSWLQLQRSTDPQFKADVAAAVEEAKEKLRWAPDRARGDESCKPPRGWRFQDGEELVVRGSRGRRVQVARFLAVLAETCNVRLSCRAVGFSEASLHAHRRRWPDFDARCEDALLIGYERIDTGLAHAACRLFSPDAYPLPDAPAIAPMDASAAISLMRLHERRRWEAARGIGPCGRVWRWGDGRG